MTDVSKRRRQPKGIPAGGEFADESRKLAATDLADTDPWGGTEPQAPDPLLMELTAGMREKAVKEHVAARTADETRELLAEADSVDIGPDGIILLDKDGNPIYTQTGQTAHLDYRTLRADPKVKAKVRETLRADLKDVKYAQRRQIVRQAWNMAGPYDRRLAIDDSPNRRFIPPSSITRSLRARRDQDKAVQTLVDLFHEDANVASGIIRSGFPKDRRGAFAFINKTKNLHYDKDTKDKDGVLHKAGRPVYGTYYDKDGKERYGILPNPKGAAARSYLRMLYQPTNGVPTDPETNAAVVRTLNDIGDIGGPEAQAKAFWNICYGDGSPSNLKGDVDYAMNIAGMRKGNRRGLGAIREYMNGTAGRSGGQGNAARIAAYQGGLTREAAIAFCAMEPGDRRSAHTGLTRRRRNTKTGEMENVKPRRLSEMRSYIHQVYSISDKDVAEYKAANTDMIG